MGRQSLFEAVFDKALIPPSKAKCPLLRPYEFPGADCRAQRVSSETFIARYQCGSANYG